MKAPLLHIQQDQHLWLSPERALFWEEEKALVLSDLHLGKSGHFRKSGIAIPQQVNKNDMQRLMQLIQYFQPRSVIVVGDMFHSRSNKELDLFLKWRKDFPDLSFHLVKGNHDILADEWYREAGLDLHAERLELPPFRFIHEENETDYQGPHYTLSGHIHPGVLLRGTGKQSLRFPCFYFGSKQCILPAFGGFTGLAIVNPTADDRVFAIVEDSLLPF